MQGQRSSNIKCFSLVLKFGLSEKHTKICTIFLMLCTFTLGKRPNHEEDFFSNFVCFSESPNFMTNGSKVMTVLFVSNPIYSPSILKIYSFFSRSMSRRIRRPHPSGGGTPLPPTVSEAMELVNPMTGGAEAMDTV